MSQKEQPLEITGKKILQIGFPSSQLPNHSGEALKEFTVWPRAIKINFATHVGEERV